MPFISDHRIASTSPRRAPVAIDISRNTGRHHGPRAHCSIEKGKLADLAVLSKDYAECPEDEIKDIKALRTIVGGKVVYDKLPADAG